MKNKIMKKKAKIKKKKSRRRHQGNRWKILPSCVITDRQIVSTHFSFLNWVAG